MEEGPRAWISATAVGDLDVNPAFCMAECYGRFRSESADANSISSFSLCF